MKEPVYRWLCPMCGISDEAENSEMARVNIDVHVQLAHPSARGAARGEPDPARLLVLGDERDSEDGGGAAAGGDGRVRP
jgi:hypothetical protein